ncbi:MAG TPA: hypothetical protein VMB48_17705 [Steroidobacteraceae bacterium]|nr:hypothetical protein [Steroidobacteraceae bacterium]
MKTLTTVLVLAGMAVARAQAGCDYPKAPDNVPNGSTASKAEMLAAARMYRDYNAQIKSYTDCLKVEHDAQVAKIDPKLPPDQQAARKAELDKILAQKNDAAVDEATAATDRFNAQIHAYNDKHKG